MGIPVVNIGTRQHGRDRGENVLDVDYDKQEIKNAIQQHLKHGKYAPQELYGVGEAGQKIADVLATIKLRFHKTINY